ncbi:MAG: HEAT repeat domain-containing protein [Verrucomicrobiae bacterium]|nr:HEAT repeat domain-containing protein [Verrucomicrobiae bacterium]
MIYPLWLLLIAFPIARAAEPFPEVPPVPATETAKDFQLLDGFRMTLLAAEPLVTDPVALCYDEDGRAYVAEMNDYPYTDKAKHKPMQENPTDKAIGKIRLLEDVDGDGVFDKATVFAEGLSWPTGVVPWKGGIFVTAAPDLWYFKDTDGDGKADVKEKVLTGYRKYNVQAEVNNPIWGLDNRIYITSSSNGGKVYAPGDGPAGAVEIGRNDVRLDPAAGSRFELISGGGQFGNTFDDWGNRFLCSNSSPVWNVVMPVEALSRHPWLPSRQTTQLCTTAEDPIELFPITAIEAWRLQRYQDRTFVPRKGYKFPRGRNAGDPSSPTSSSAAVVYRGDAYPEAYRGSMIVTEPCYNLVFHVDMKASGATFSVSKPESAGKADLVASTDVWFRPTNSVNAPDGCLHITDLYREAIEHPWSLPDAFHERMDLERGRDRGRIYRLEPPGYRHRPAPKLSGASSLELVALLEHPNAWHRETAQRLLFERQDRSVVDALRALARKSAEPRGRLHALWTLDGLEMLEPEDVELALGDSSPGVRANAAKLAARLAGKWPGFRKPLVALAGDPEAAVRFQAALALGAGEPDDTEPSVTGALAEIARRDSGDSWIRLAVLTSSLPHAAAILEKLLADGSFTGSASSGEMLGSLARLVGARNQSGEPAELIGRLAGRGKPDRSALAVVTGLSTGLRSAKSNLSAVAGEAPGGKVFLDSVFAEASVRAADRDTSVVRRSEAIALLRDAPFDAISALLENLLDAVEPPEVRSSAAAALSTVGGARPEVGPLLLRGWEGYSGELRSQVVQLLLERKERLGPLLDAIEAGQILPHQIGATRQELLLAHKDPAISARAKELFAGAGSRSEVLERYKDVATFDGDPAKGEAVYQGICMGCHKFREQGLIDLAPNLAVVEGWEIERIVTNVMDPNREVAPEYMEYLVETRGGTVLTGRVVAESESGITLKTADNRTTDIPRAEIAKLQNSGRSLMPEGLEVAVSPQAMADLIAFLRARP